MASQITPDVFGDAAKTVSELVSQIVELHGVCSVVVSGGSAIHHTLERLATCDVPWSSVRLYMADERCVPRDDKGRNDAMVFNILVQPVQIKLEHFFQIPAELGPHLGAKSYAQTLSSIDHFDIALLGVGPDGHIASLFPNHPSIENKERVIAVQNSPKFPPNRVSVGLTMLRDATHRIVVVTGGEKSNLIARLEEGEKPPVALVNPTKWFLDLQVTNIENDSATTMQQGSTS
ncbi:MAG: 6-phosphogluconolactonase [Ilumatobacteraceae bacterium]